MLYTKDGYPEIGEIIKCTITKIYGNTTFVHLDEYDKEGVLTISEIAPGRIRNLRDHVMEDKVIICKVLRVDEASKRIDVSLRRVPVPVMKDKQEELKKEEFADKLYQDIAKKLGITKDILFEKTYEPIFEDYPTVFECMYEIMLDNKKAEIFTKLDKKEQQLFIETINDKIKPEEIVFKKTFKITSLEEEGATLIKNAIGASLKPLNYDKIKIVYLAAGKFGLTIVHDEVKQASLLFDQFKKNIEQQTKDHKIAVEF